MIAAAPTAAMGNMLIATLPTPLFSLFSGTWVFVALELTMTVAGTEVVVVWVVVVVPTMVVTKAVDSVVGTTTTLVLVAVAVSVAGTTAVAETVLVTTAVDVSAVLVSTPEIPTVVLEKVVVGGFATIVVPSETFVSWARTPAADNARTRGTVNFILTIL